MYCPGHDSHACGCWTNDFYGNQSALASYAQMQAQAHRNSCARPSIPPPTVQEPSKPKSNKKLLLLED